MARGIRKRRLLDSLTDEFHAPWVNEDSAPSQFIRRNPIRVKKVHLRKKQQRYQSYSFYHVFDYPLPLERPLRVNSRKAYTSRSCFPPKKRYLAFYSAFYMGLVVLLSFFSYRFLINNQSQLLEKRLAVDFCSSVSLAMISPKFSVQESGDLVLQTQKGDTFPFLLDEHGLDSQLSLDLHQAFEELPQHGALVTNPLTTPGSTLEFRLVPKVGVTRLHALTPSEQGIVFRRTSDHRFHAKLDSPSKVQSTERIALGVIQTSFAAAAQQAGVSYNIIDEVVDLYSDHIVFDRDFRLGDRFTIIYQDPNSKKLESSKENSILAVALTANGNKYVATRFIGTDGKARYFDSDGNIIGNGFLRYPLQFSRVTSYFSEARFHPVLKRSRPHYGVDFAAPVGTPVRAVANGKISFAGLKGPNGIMVKIDHNERYSTAYLHLSSVAFGLLKGDSVTRGQIIGTVGATGLATGPHLHYSFFDRGRYVDPLTIELPTIDTLSEGTKISSNYLYRVLFTLDHYQSLDFRQTDI